MFETLKRFNFISFLKLIGLALVLYYFTVAFNGVVSPEGTYYSAFLDHHLNFIDSFRGSIMFVANLITHSVGTNSYIANHQLMKVGKNIEFEIWLPCLGFGIISFWISFIVNSSSTLMRKSMWCVFGILSIWFINCLRIALFIISVDKNWPQNKLIDHHDMFNLVAYLLIVTLMYSYTKNETQNQEQPFMSSSKNLRNALPNR
jgi:exosortase/archaeosortase family protein